MPPRDVLHSGLSDLFAICVPTARTNEIVVKVGRGNFAQGFLSGLGVGTGPGSGSCGLVDSMSLFIVG